MSARLAWAIVALFPAAVAVAAQAAPRELGLAEAVGLARKADPEVAAAAQGEAALEQSVGIARAGYLPTIDFDAIDSTGFPGSTGALGIGGLMGSPYRSGAAGGLVAKQTLLDFGRTSSGVEAAKHDLRAAREADRVTAYESGRRAARAFYECVRFRSQSETWSYVLEQAKLVNQEVQRFVSTGQRSIVEKYLAQAQLEEARTSEADYSVRVKLALRSLGLVTGLNPVSISCPNLEKARSAALLETGPAGEHPLIGSAKESAQAAQARLSQARAGNYPRVVAIASAGDLESSRLVAKNDYSLGVGIVFPLFNGWATSHEVGRAEALAAASELKVDASRERVDEANTELDTVIESSRERLVHLDQELKLAEEAFSVAKKRYLSLQGALIDVREALRDLTRVRTRLNDTETDYLEASAAKALFNGS